MKTRLASLTAILISSVLISACGKMSLPGFNLNQGLLEYSAASLDEALPISLAVPKSTVNMPPIFSIESIEEGFVRITIIDPEVIKPRILFEGSIQGIAMPRNSLNVDTIDALQKAGFHVFDIDPKSPKAQNTFAIVSNAGVYAYQLPAPGAPIESVYPIVVRFPVTLEVDVRHLYVTRFYIDWKSPEHVVHSFEFKAPLAPHSYETTRTGAYVYRSAATPELESSTRISTFYTNQISLAESGNDLTVSFKPPDKLQYDLMVIKDGAAKPSSPWNQFRPGSPSPGSPPEVLRLPAPAPPPSDIPSIAPDLVFERPERNFREYLSEFSKALNIQVLGQPEAIDVLLDIEKQNILNNGARKTPEIAMFMGLPGTGKDTLVEAYVRTRMQVTNGDFEGIVEDHIFRTPVAKKESDIWSLTGSGTGYKGSDHVSALIRFLVQHSGGRYEIHKTPGPNPEEYVIESKSWRPGQVLPGYSAPQDGAIYVNELHDWSKELKNSILKEALEKGFFTIGNPGPGLNRIEVPITIFLASNNGVGLITARDKDGRRVGAPLDAEQMLERWKLHSPDKAALKADMAEPSPGNVEGGTSEEVLSRIPNSRLLLLRPLSQAALGKITEMKLSSIREKFAGGKGMGFPAVTLDFSPNLRKFLSSYDQLAEEGARPLEDKVKTLVEKTLTDAIFSGRLNVKDGDTLNLGVRKNHDNTYSMMIGS
ncbi:MAG: hypothetical protein RBT63_00865, partial [Bdellovibrionales bacterium]|nr:hypothetical protein [Bdellovibrionales bacterium]